MPDAKTPDSKTLVLLSSLACDLEPVLRRHLQTPYALIALPDTSTEAEIAAAMQRANALLTLRYDRKLPAPRLRFLQVAGAGYDRIDMAALPPGVTVSNAFGHEQAIGEYVLLGMLLWSHDLLEAERSFRAGSWRMSGRMQAPIHGEIGGKTVGILGVGRIGRAVARLAKPFGMRVLGCNRTLRDEPDIARMYGFGALHEFLGQCDFVANCAALAPETAGLIDAAAFAAMRPGAVLLNVGRGETVDEDALYDALKTRRIAGAVLDAWYRYPSAAEPDARPSRHPFHELPNVVMTPHSSAWTHGMIERRVAEMADNLDRFARGETPRNVVHQTG
jgi:phosphoglycerate dehydrogenase-like enzyme